MAKILNCTLEEIYEPEDGIYLLNGENTHANSGDGCFAQHTDFIFDTMKKYIAKLETEIVELNKNLVEK
jgi:hypothetical protein